MLQELFCWQLFRIEAGLPAGVSKAGSPREKLRHAGSGLLCFLLFLLADADLELFLLRLAVSLPVKALRCIGHIGVDVRAFRKNSHYGSGLTSVRAGDTKPANIRNCHKCDFNTRAVIKYRE